ncbi:MAG: proteasome assembly chaperone family protein [Thermoplasmata archaeon]|nr:MAG: proteasome assembly chaperone family protein [Thermoplasmata archaeon]
MEEIYVEYISEPKLTDPILIEGLPGVGNVGKLAAEHLIDKLKAKKFANIYSRFFPPQVLVGKDGVVRLVSNELFFVKKNKNNQTDIIFLVGDYQGLTPEGQYEISMKILEIAEKFNIKKIFTLGGYGLGRMVEKARVLGAATNPELVKEMKEHGVIFQEGEPGSGIVGASGLLLGLGKIQNIEGVCLMGETSGYFADPKSAQAVLGILTKILDVTIDYSELESKATQIEKITAHIQDLDTLPEKTQDDLRYIG